MKRRSLVLVALLAAVLVAAGAFVARRHAAQPAKQTPVAAKQAIEFLPGDLWVAAPVSLARSLPVTGSLRAANQTTVKTRVAGDLLEVLVREGEAVRKGQTVARLDATEYEWRVKREQASLAAAQAQLEMATKTRTNNAQLLAQGFISQNAFDNAQSGLDSALGSRDAAAAALELSRKSLADTVIAAPMTGTVAERFAQPGEKLPVDGKILSLVDLASIELEIPVPADDIGQVAVGQRVEFGLEGNSERRAGTVVRISPSTAAGSRSVLVYVAMGKPDPALRAGMFAQGRLLVEPSEPTLAVPVSAVHEEAGGHLVLVVANGRIDQAPVTIGRRGSVDSAGPELMEIRSGLAAGAQVVRSFDARLTPGAAAVVAGGPAASR
jgi:membrane fusion protein, multidrug efflux system